MSLTIANSLVLYNLILCIRLLRNHFVSSGISWEEENWRAQYGQVTEQIQVSVLDIQAIDLWDWEMVKKTTKSRKNGVCKLVGRLVKCTNMLHPSLASSGSRLKTSAICEVHLDLVKVRSGLSQILFPV